jgi:hypothetical protein
VNTDPDPKDRSPDLFLLFVVSVGLLFTVGCLLTVTVHGLSLILVRLLSVDYLNAASVVLFVLFCGGLVGLVNQPTRRS